MKLSHLLALALIAFIVFRLTQTVQVPPPQEPQRRGVTEVFQTNGEPARPIRIDQDGGESRASTESTIKTLLQRLMSAAPAATPREQAAADWILTSPPKPLPGEPLVVATGPGSPAQIPLTPRERLKIREANRPLYNRQYGRPHGYQGIILRHLDNGAIIIRSKEEGELMVEQYEPGERQADSALITFEAWPTGLQQIFTNAKGEERTVRRLIYATPPLPVWDKYGRPLNRDVLAPETIREAGIHSSSAFERTSTTLDRKRE
jgi:hypothetical protein